MGESREPEQNHMAMATIPQLNGLKKNIEHELQGLNQNRETLKAGQQRMQHAMEALHAIKAADGESMIPMTGSVYMRGTISADHVKKILIDVGTGYFIEKPILGAMNYCKKRADMLGANAVGVTNIIKNKVKQMEMIEMNMRVKAQQAAQEEEAMGASA